MFTFLAGVAGGLSAGGLTSAAAMFGRKNDLIHPTLAENVRDWVNRRTSATRALGDEGVSAQQMHFIVAGVLGAVYGLLRPALRFVPAPIAGALFGAGVYAVNAATIAPAVGVTEGEERAPEAVTRERLAVNIGFGVVTALVVAALVERRRSHDDDED